VAERYGDPKVDEVLAIAPGQRGPLTADLLYNEMVGILLGFQAVLEARRGHVDIITVRYAVDEMKQMLAREVASAIGDMGRLNEAKRAAKRLLNIVGP
jgi:hypothetical protein